MDYRSFEKSKKSGYLFYIEYNGKNFDSFDEMKGKKTVKGEFVRVMYEIGFTWAKGVQQAGRTDAKVSARENILYVSSNFNGNKEKVIGDFNKLSKGLKIKKIEKTLPNLVLPDYVEAREYIYSYPQEKLEASKEEIEARCEEVSGEYDVSKWTDEKGKKLKEHVRMVEVSYDGKELLFYGNSFMPKQVRIMSSYVLSGEKKVFPAKYLSLNSVVLKEELLKLIFREEELSIKGVSRVEVCDKLKIFYVKKNKKSEVIGTRGKNIKKLRKEYGDLIIREM